MTYQIHALDAADFAPLFALSDNELEQRNAKRMVATSSPGFPCRVSLEDAAVGETVYLINFEHMSKASPFRASHAIYVREGAEQTAPAPGETPALWDFRLLSLRGFDAGGMMIAADVVEGADAGAEIARMFENQDIEEIHVHYAKPGCFAARAVRA